MKRMIGEATRVWYPACMAALLTMSQAALAQGASKLDLLRDDDTVITGTLQAGINAVAEENMYWNLAEIFAPSIDYDASPQWLELYLKPGITAEQTVGGGAVLYGRVSVVGSATLGIDGFAEGNTGRVLMEEAVLGVRLGKRETGQFDLSTGAQELKLGTGMLIANGASNGFERGAVKLGPRKAWEGSVLAKFIRGGFAVQGFVIDPPNWDPTTRAPGLPASTFAMMAGTAAMLGPVSSRSCGRMRPTCRQRRVGWAHLPS